MTKVSARWFWMCVHILLTFINGCWKILNWKFLITLGIPPSDLAHSGFHAFLQLKTESGGWNFANEKSLHEAVHPLKKIYIFHSITPGWKKLNASVSKTFKSIFFIWSKIKKNIVIWLIHLIFFYRLAHLIIPLSVDRTTQVNPS